MIAGRRLEWPHRRTTNPDSRLWRVVGTAVVRRRWLAAIGATAVLVALAAPLTGLTLADPTNASLASRGGPPAAAFTAVRDSGLGQGITEPVEVVTTSPDRLATELASVPGVAAVVAPEQWSRGDARVVDVWTRDDVSTSSGAAAAAAVRSTAESSGASVGGLAAQNADFISAVYGNAWWIIGLIVIVTFALLARALRSVVLPLKRGAQRDLARRGLRDHRAHLAGRVRDRTALRPAAVGCHHGVDPIAVFAFLFGLSMDYEVFLLGRIREEYDAGASTDRATITGVTRTGRLVTSAALILFLAFISLSRVPATDVKILATALALGIIIDATIVRGVLAPALVAGFGRANWWAPWSRAAPTPVAAPEASAPLAAGRHRQGDETVDFAQWRLGVEKRSAGDRGI